MRVSGRLVWRLAGAVLALAASVAVIASSLRREPHPSLSLATVPLHVPTESRVSYTLSQPSGSSAPTTSHVTVFGPLVRIDRPGGSYTVVDMKGKKSLVVDHESKTAHIRDGVADEGALPPAELDEYLDPHGAPRSGAGPHRDIEGKRAVSIPITDRGQNGLVWVDAQAREPLLIELGNAGSPAAKRLSHFTKDAKVDVSTMQMSAPVGYAVNVLGTDTVRQDNPSESLIVRPGIGVGRLTLGMSRKEADTLPEKPASEQPLNMGVVRLTYPAQGLALVFAPRAGLETISCLGKQSDEPGFQDFPGKTDRGIGLGSKRADIIRVYGEPDFIRTRDNPAPPKGQTRAPTAKPRRVALYYQRLRLEFELLDDLITQFNIRRLPH